LTLPSRSEPSSANVVKVSFLIVNWNVREYIVPCVRSIYASKPPDLVVEVIIVDNASSDGAKEYLPVECPEAKLIFSDQNLGYGRANNLAFEHSQGEFVFVLNPDTEMIDSSWTDLVKVLDEEPQTGIAGPTIYLGDGSVQCSCARREDKMVHCVLYEVIGLSKLGWVRRRGMQLRSSYYPTESDIYVEAVSGAAMLVRKDVYANIGGFDPEFLHGGEDVYFCKRCRDMGYRIKFVASAKLNHYHNKSGAKASVKTYVKGLDSRFTFFRKVEGLPSAMTFRVSVLIFYCTRLLVVAIVGTIKRNASRKENWQMASSVLSWCIRRRIS